MKDMKLIVTVRVTDESKTLDDNVNDLVTVLDDKLMCDDKPHISGFYVEGLCENDAAEVDTQGFDLVDTVHTMLSNKYDDRLIAEYNQLRIRIDILSSAIAEIVTTGKLHGHTIKVPVSVMEAQLEVMRKYATILEARAAIDNIRLSVNPLININKCEE